MMDNSLSLFLVSNDGRVLETLVFVPLDEHKLFRWDWQREETIIVKKVKKEV